MYYIDKGSWISTLKSIEIAKTKIQYNCIKKEENETSNCSILSTISTFKGSYTHLNLQVGESILKVYLRQRETPEDHDSCDLLFPRELIFKQIPYFIHSRVYEKKNGCKPYE